MGRHILSDKTKTSRFTAGLLSIILGSATLVGLAIAPTAANAAGSDPVLSLSATSTASILAGSTSKVTLDATNISTSTDLYNLSFSDELPAGVTYVSGSTAPSTIGDPTVTTVIDSTTPAVSHQVLIWSNVSDLIAANDSSLSFSVSANPTAFPVGSNYAGVTHAYAQSDPRTLPKFSTTTGQVTAGTYTNSDTQTPTATQVSALNIVKTQNNPESELMRGIHSQTTTYNIKVTNTNQGATNGVTVTDYLPAQLEFLSCGATDNSSAAEYAGAPSLTATPVPANCLTPTSVDTVSNPTGYPAGVYTKVVWTLGNMAAGATTTFNYAAGIPLKANTLTFSSTKPTAASDGQASNLDNNNGASTRQVGNGASYTNTAVAAGTYTGAVASGTSNAVTSTDTATVESDDLDVVSTASTGTFTTGATVTYNLLIRSGEYTSSDNMTVTDTLPDGICPFLPAGTPTTGTVPSDCKTTGTVTGGTITNATINSDGTYTLTFSVAKSPLTANQTTNIVYKALMRTNYDASNTDPTASGDSFATKTTITGTSTAVAATGQTPATQTVTDDSATTEVSSAPTISKKILPRTTVASPAACEAAGSANYVDNTAATPKFIVGDRVCFQLTVNFSSSSDTRNAKVKDFAPVGTHYESYVLGSAADGNTLPAADLATPTAGTVPSWSLGHTVGSDTTNLFVTKGTVLVMYVSAIVDNPSTSATTADLTANLMKYSQQSTNGKVLALRDNANFGLLPAATATITKGITAVNGTANTAPYPTTASIAGTSTADFALTVKNTGTAAIGNNQDESNFVVWDALPSGLNCATVSNITQGGTCTDNYSGLTGTNSGLSALVWNISSTVTAGSTATPLSYRVTIPAVISVSATLTNNASIVSFQTANTTGGLSNFYPTNSLDSSKAGSANTAAANAAASLTVPNVSVAKTVTSPVDAPNNGTGDAVGGEMLTYSYTVSIPAHTTVYNGTVTDPIPSYTKKIASTTETDNIPSSVNTSTATSFTTAFPAVYTNTTDATQVFTVTLTNLEAAPGSLPAATVYNAANFVSTTQPSASSTAVPTRSGSVNLNYVTPKPTVTNTVSSTAGTAGQNLVYTLSTTNAVGSPNGYDTIISDCLPAGINFVSDNTLPAGVTRNAPTMGNVTNNCAANQTLIQYNVGTVAPGTTVTVKFNATVDPSAAGASTYTTSATATMSTLNDGTINSANEGVYKTAAATNTVTISGVSITKTTTKAKATIGETVPYTITVTVPANVNFYDASIIDTTPTNETVVNGSAVVTCVDSSGTNCNSTLPGNGNPMTASGQKMGLYLGNLTSYSNVRTITATYNETISDVAGNVTGTVETNTANLSWNTTDTGAPANAGATFNKTSANPTAVTTVTQPSLSINKTTTNAKPEPGQTFNYNVAVVNSNGANASAAYQVVVTDNPPAGVVVDPSTISNGGTIAGQNANGGGTITWNIAGPIAVGATQNLTYAAKLADSSTLSNNAALVNTAAIPSYASLATGGRVYTTKPTSSATVTPNFPSVTVGKSDTNGNTAYINKPFSWTLTFKNAANAGVANKIIPTDVLPENWVYDANSAYVTSYDGTVTQVDPTVTTNGDVETLTWAGGGYLGAGQSGSIVYTAHPTTAALTSPGIGHGVNPSVNTVSAVTQDLSGATGNANGSFTGGPASATAYIDNAQVVVTNTAGDPLVAGTTTDKAWSVVVSNNGPDTAVGPFTVTDTIPTLPDGVTVSSVGGKGWSCATDEGGTTFTCERTNANDNLTNGASFDPIVFGVTAGANVPEGTKVSNTATATDSTASSNPDKATASSAPVVTTKADLAVTVTTSGDINAGQTATWVLNVTNNGPSESHSPITVTDTLPAGLTNVTATGTGWTCDTSVAGTITCTTGDLGVGTASQITVTGNVDSSYTGDMTNKVTVTGTTTDVNQANNTDTATDTVNTDTTVIGQKAVTKGDLTPGETSTYTISVANTGTADARNVKIVDVLPDGLTFAGNTASANGTWTCNNADNTVTCLLADNLSAKGGKTATTVSFDVNVASSYTGTVTNTATISSDNAADVPVKAVGTPTGKADLSVTETHSDGPIYAGNTVTYTVSTHNAGPSDHSKPITVTGTLPTGLTVKNVTADGWNCDVSKDGTSYTCALPDGLTAGADAPDITVVATIDPTTQPSTLDDTVTVTGSSTIVDPNLDNNSTDSPVQVETLAHVTISKTGEATIVPGENTTYKIAVHNDGPSYAANITVTDNLPAGLSLVSMSGNGWNCSTDTASCTNVSLPLGDSTITVAAKADSNLPNDDTIVNNATATWSDSGNTTDATSSATGDTATSADLSIKKTAISDTVKAGDNTSFNIAVKDLGSSDAAGPITVTDILPDGMSFIGASGDWTCAPDADDAQKVVCVLNNNTFIPAGGTASNLTVMVHLDSADAADPLTNTASVSSTTVDPDLSNNVSGATVNVAQETDLSITKNYTGTPHIDQPITFHYGVHNGGFSDANTVTVTDLIPSSITDIKFDGTDPAWTCTATPQDNGTLITCVLNTPLVAGQDTPVLQVTGTLTAASYPKVGSTATVATTTPETNLDNNTAGVNVPVPPWVGLNISVKHITDIVPGKNAQYQIDVVNNGITEAPDGFTIVDTLPKGVTYHGFTGDGWSCTASGQVVTCVYSKNLPLGDTASLILNVGIGSGVTGDVTDSVSVSTPDEQVAGAVVNATDTVNIPKPVTPGKPGTPTSGNPTPGSPTKGSGSTPTPTAVVQKVLAFTGSQGTAALAGFAVLLLAVGGGLLFWRRRKPAED